MHLFLSGGIMVAAWVAGLVFLRFWKRTRDRLFLIFCISFWLLACERWFLLTTPAEFEARTWIYVIRLLAFTFIIVGIVDKNRVAKRVDVTASARTPSHSH